MAEHPRHERPLGRTLDPLPDESLGGYLLRLAHRLRLSPIRVARLTGIKAPTETVLGRRLLLDLDVDRFARATRLTEDETAGLTFLPWQGRYPPIARALTAPNRRGTREDWLFNDFPRYCPQCLAGDSGPLRQHGGAWKTTWHLPITFACPAHEVFLQHGCPQGHELQRTLPHLINQAADGPLHPAQCRLPVLSDDPDTATGRGRTGRSCGARLERRDPAGPFRPSTSMLKTQRDLLGLLSPGRPAEESSSRFTDLRVITSLPCTTWPNSRDMLDPRAREAVDEHVQALGAGREAGTRQAAQGLGRGSRPADRRVGLARRPRPRRSTGPAHAGGMGREAQQNPLDAGLRPAQGLVLGEDAAGGRTEHPLLPAHQHARDQSPRPHRRLPTGERPRAHGTGLVRQAPRTA
ncbi:TniQ family protein [Streptomyces sp. NPDC051639]|uniref:TniQ family protein n=1 Tax=Streptomyces sp. NPDC051639 TaxID=3155671 RepID=UPI003417DCB3